MSTTIEDVMYGEYLAELAEDATKEEAISEFKEVLLRKYYLSNRKILQPTIHAKQEAIALYKSKHFTASYLFGFIAIELIIKDLIIAPLLKGQIINDEMVEVIYSTFRNNSKNHSSYQKVLIDFVKTYAKLDIKDYGSNNLIAAYEQLASLRNNILHNGESATKVDAKKILDLSNEYYSIAKVIMTNLEIDIDKKSWEINSRHDTSI